MEPQRDPGTAEGLAAHLAAVVEAYKREHPEIEFLVVVSGVSLFVETMADLAHRELARGQN